jgi:hypothetical protein
MFRESARKMVLEVQKENEDVRHILEDQARQIGDLRTAHEKCETRCRLLMMNWPPDRPLPRAFPK